jgi:hypothetical protein
MKVYNSKSVRNIVMAGWLVLMALGLIVVPSAAHAQVVNLVNNPSFEEDEVILDDDTWTSWATWGWEDGLNSTVEFNDTEFIDGTRSLRIMPIGADNWHFILLHMNIPVQVGTRYTASFWAKAEAPRPLAAKFKAVDNSVDWGQTSFQLTTEWAEYSMTSAALNGNAKIEFFCAGSEVPFWLDFVYVYEGDHVAGIEPSTAVPEQFHIVDFQPVTGGWSLTWESAVGQPATYTVQRQTNLALAWDTLAEDIPSQGTTTSYTDTDAPATTAFYRVLKTPPLPLFQTGFEPDEDLTGWTQEIISGPAQWEVGRPTSGPGSARTGVNVLATKLAGDYDQNVHAGYRSPTIDLTGVDSAVLEFYHYYDFEFIEGVAFDWGEVFLFDTAGQNLLPGAAVRFQGASGGWRRVAYRLPAEALGKPVRFEFRLFSDEINPRPGWYIDDIVIK